MWRFSAHRVLSSFVSRRKPVQDPFEPHHSNKREVCRKPRCLEASTSGAPGSNKNEGSKEKKKWQDNAGHCYFQKNCIIETLGWLGTAFVLGLNLRYRLCKSHQARTPSSERCSKETDPCIDITTLLYRLALAAPGKRLLKSQALPEPEVLQVESDTSHAVESNQKKLSEKEDIGKGMRKLVDDYTSLMENIVGLQLVDSKPEKAIAHLEISAALGCSSALFNLGLCYEMGRGTSVDLVKAAQHYQLAAEAGHDFAAYNLGVFYLEGLGGLQKNYHEGFKLISKAANKGVTKAQTALGILYTEKEEWLKAFELFEAASKQGDLEAVYQLGMCYENGWGVPQDMAKAAEMYTQASYKNHDQALYSLGMFYEKGRGGLERNSELAAAMYQMAIDMGNEQAKESLKVLQEAEAAKYQYVSAKSQSKNTMKERENSISVSNSNVLHNSLSSPELNKPVNPIEEHQNISISQYLGLILPNILSENEKLEFSDHKFSLKDDNRLQTAPQIWAVT